MREAYLPAAGFAASVFTSGFTSAPPSVCFFAFFTFFGFASVLTSAVLVSVAAGAAAGLHLLSRWQMPVQPEQQALLLLRRL
jgi:hypothetical protein